MSTVKRAPYKKRAQPPKKLKPGISIHLPEAQVYTQLLEFERRLDSVIARRQLDINESRQLHSSVRTTRTLRLFIYNLFGNQTAQYHTSGRQDLVLGENASWTLRIEGTLLPDESLMPAKALATRRPRPKFTAFFSKLFVQFESQMDGQRELIGWERTPSFVETDGFEIKRLGNRELLATIMLYFDHAPQRFKLSRELSALLHITRCETNANVVRALWSYVKLHNLHDPADRRTILCNQQLKQVFECDSFQWPNVTAKLAEHLSAPDPLVFNFPIRLGGDSRESEQVYDIEVEMDDSMQQIAASATDPTLPLQRPYDLTQQQLRQLEVLEMQQADSLVVIQGLKRKRDFFEHFASSPIDALHKLLASHSHDLAVLQSTVGVHAEEERHSEFFAQPVVAESVAKYLSHHPRATAASFQ